MRCYLLLFVLATGITVAAPKAPPQPESTSVGRATGQATAVNEARSEPDVRGTPDLPAIVELTRTPVLKVEAVEKPERPVNHLGPGQ
jgi:hypothetical protein